MSAAIAVLGVAVFAAVYWIGLRQRQIHRWFWSYCKDVLFRKRPRPAGTVDILFCFVDHYEPLVGKADFATGKRRNDYWIEKYEEVASRFADADGHSPKHSFFYPAEEYRPEYLDRIAELCAKGYGEVEVHLHHHNDTTENFVRQMSEFVDVLRNRHGLLADWNERPTFAFIHGNWALDNSRPDGQWCGVNNEITLLKQLNCFADFTFPSAPSDTQPRTINRIYYAVDDPAKPKSHDKGREIVAGGEQSGDLLMIEGPLTLNWRRRKLGIWPRIENSDFAPTGISLRERIGLWVRQAIHVPGRPEWVFVKIHTHGVDDTISRFMFEDGAFDELCCELQAGYNDGKRYRLHYVSARECYNIAKAAQAGCAGNPNEYRDYVIAPPKQRKSAQAVA